MYEVDPVNPRKRQRVSGVLAAASCGGGFFHSLIVESSAVGRAGWQPEQAPSVGSAAAEPTAEAAEIDPPFLGVLQ